MLPLPRFAAHFIPIRRRPATVRGPNYVARCAMIWEGIAAVSPWSLLAIVFILVITGLLVPRRHLTDARKNYERELARSQHISDDWQAAATANGKTASEALRQTDMLLDSVRTNEQRPSHNRGVNNGNGVDLHRRATER